MKPQILKLIRSKLDLTQKQASEIIEVSDKTWQQWESGKTEMHPAYYSFLQEKLKDKINFDELTVQKTPQKQIFEGYSQNQISKNAEELAEITHIEERKHAHNSDFKFIDLFAGIGGIRQSFEVNGGKCVFSSEIDPLQNLHIIQILV